ncbi:cytochrome b [Pseudovibrio sp. Tun.PSC04-5.I4]|uniref:cytochrome b n=1 Tax=Pseudovibrio sp. Tun.PSC04-5.I4 TaxID=1798213 RepID=UPI00089228FD|nr:cytochrome b [Pseudovibrio sp. Tun.PSC04-5.I4]SDQ91904.1 cytochrome b561 [Pseudovibrio sp. Tun.PSC04-5.I4]
MIRNTRSAYGSVAIALHWTIATLIIGMLGFGLYMVTLPIFEPSTYTLYQLHKSIGFVILTLVTLRLLWKLSGATPTLPAEMPWWEQAAAHLGHLSLYALMVLMPLTGWFLVSTSPLGLPTVFFNLFQIPHLPTFEFLGQKADVSAFFTEVHGWAAYAFIAVIAAHVGAALKHHFISKDKVLQRMLSSKP